MIKLLIVDDNEQITQVLRAFAQNEGMKAELAYDGLEAWDKFKKEDFDLILLDVMMPKLDGFKLLKRIRKESMVPVILITAKGEDYERIMGLDYGADDYIVKPFSVAEVMARVRAILRRVHLDEGANRTISIRSLYLDLDSYVCEIGGKQIDLTKKEFEILWLLAENKDKVFTRDNLLDSLWGDDYFGDIRTVDTHIKRLRSKVKDKEDGWSISTVRGVGYKFEVEDVK